nr:hypothetical protein GCM10025699_19350 [Microbacterium flavescens]
MALRVGVVGGGQLARMMIAPAVELGIELRVLAEEAGMSASLAATAVGDYRDTETVLAFARDVDVVTFDHEHVPQDVLTALVDAGIAVHPGPETLAVAQDKLVMRARMTELGMPQPDWAAVTGAEELQAFLDAHGGRAVVKTPRGGYDGKESAWSARRPRPTTGSPLWPRTRGRSPPGRGARRFLARARPAGGATALRRDRRLSGRRDRAARRRLR